VSVGSEVFGCRGEEMRCRCICGGLIDECGVNCALRVFVYEFAGVSLCV